MPRKLRKRTVVTIHLNITFRFSRHARLGVRRNIGNYAHNQVRPVLFTLGTEVLVDPTFSVFCRLFRGSLLKKRPVGKQN